MKLNQSIKNYNDGVLKYGAYIEDYDSNGDATTLTFTPVGKFFYGIESIRESDLLNYNSSGLKLDLKLRVQYNNQLKSSHYVVLDGKTYSILKIDTDKFKTINYLYLTSKLDLLKYTLTLCKKDPLTNSIYNDVFNDYKTIFCNIETVDYTHDAEVNKHDANFFNPKRKFIIRYIKDLDINLNDNITTNFKIKFKRKLYDIVQIINVNESDELFEVIGVIE